MRLPVAAVRSGDISPEIQSHISEGLDYIQVHPTFLYESIWCFLLFLFLLWLDRHAKAGHGFEGRIILTYGMLYSLERFFVEALRTDSLMIGPFKQAQVISLVIFTVCLIGYVVLRRRAR